MTFNKYLELFSIRHFISPCGTTFNKYLELFSIIWPVSMTFNLHIRHFFQWRQFFSPCTTTNDLKTALLTLQNWKVIQMTWKADSMTFNLHIRHFFSPCGPNHLSDPYSNSTLFPSCRSPERTTPFLQRHASPELATEAWVLYYALHLPSLRLLHW